MASRTLDIVISGDAKSALAAFAATQAAAIKTQTKVGRALTGIKAKSAGALAGGVVLAAAAGGAALVNLGDEFAKATNTIRVGTGATGKDLKRLKRDFKGVLTAVPANFENASTAIADLNTRLGLTGKPLRRVATQFLELSRITGTDLSSNIASVTRLFKDWGIEGDQIAPTLDKLFRASQATGIEVDRLSQLMVQFGSPLRQLGIDFDFATAMFANFEKAGVAIETLMPGLRFGLKNLSGASPKVTKELKAMGIAAGDDVAIGLQQAFKAIKEAGNQAEANQIAFKVFGVRAGPDMAAAIREGRFELDELTKVITDGGDTIRKAGKETMTLADRWQLFKNRMSVAIEPIATKALKVFERLLDVVGNPEVAKGLLSVAAGFTAVGVSIGIFAAVTFIAANPVFLLIGALVAAGVAIFIFRDKIESAVKRVINWFRELPLAAQIGVGILATVLASPIAIMVAVVAAAVAFRDGLVGAFRAVVDWITGTFVPFWQDVWATVEPPLMTFWGIVQTVFRGVVSAVSAVVDWVTGTFVPFWVDVWERVKGPLEGFFTVVKTIFGVIAAIVLAPIIIIAAFIISHWEKIRTVTTTVFNAIRTVVVAVWNAVAATIRFVWENIILPVWNAINAFVRNVLLPVFRFLRDGIVLVWQGIRAAISASWHFIRDRILAPIGGWLDRNVLDKFRSLRDGIGRVWDAVKSKASSVWRSIIDAIKGPVNTIIRFINTMIGGINRVLDAIPGIGFQIPDIPEIGAGGSGRRNTRERQSFGLASGGVVPVGQGFTTNRPTAVVGEGSRQHPEFVVPTDPKHRRRALALFDRLGQMIRPVPAMQIGGVLGDAFGAGKEWIGDRLSDAGGFFSGLARRALVALFRPINEAVKAGLNSTPNPLHLRDAGQGVRETVWQWVRGADQGLPEAPPAPAGGSAPRGSGIAGLREPLASMVATVLRRAQGAVSVISGWRSSAKQAELYRRYLAGTGNLAARPGTSKHERGLAVDFGGNQALYQRLFREVGGHFPVGGEPWHGEVPGYRGGGFVGPRGGFAHPGELVLTKADQVAFLRTLKGETMTVIKIEPGAVVINPRPGPEAEEDGQVAAKGFLETIAERALVNDVRIG